MDVLGLGRVPPLAEVWMRGCGNGVVRGVADHLIRESMYIRVVRGNVEFIGLHLLNWWREIRDARMGKNGLRRRHRCGRC